MDELKKLEHLSLVSKVCTELDNHYGMNDKDLAEFIIHLAEKNATFDKFFKALQENGADTFSVSFCENLLRLIKHMKSKSDVPEPQNETVAKGKLSKLSQGLPFLALANEVKKESPKEEDTKEDVNDIMSQLESMAPSAQETSNSQPR